MTADAVDPVPSQAGAAREAVAKVLYERFSSNMYAEWEPAATEGGES